MPKPIPSSDALQREIHLALRLQHPEWLEVDGNCPICDLYDERFAELLRLIDATEQRLEIPRGNAMHYEAS